MTKTDQMNPFGTIKACPACDAKETWGDSNVYLAREFGREYKLIGIASGTIASTCWRCGFVWREDALYLAEESDED